MAEAFSKLDHSNSFKKTEKGMIFRGPIIKPEYEPSKRRRKK
jgi:hypothetical protein